MSEPETWNYFNYFTEAEDHFRSVRGSGLFRFSSLDWALLENWKNAGIPLEAVLRGIDATFEKWHSRKKRKIEQVNSLTYCAQAVHLEAQRMADNLPPARKVEAPFTVEELRTYLLANAAMLRGKTGFEEIVSILNRLADEADQHFGDLEELEQRLTALEDKMSAIATSTVPEENLFAMRKDLDLSLRPYRLKMTADQLAMLERQYLERRILEDAALPRLSLFYLPPSG